MKIIFLGTPNYLDPIIKSLNENFDLIKTIRSTSDFQPGVVKLNLENLKPDLLVVASFGKIIPADILRIPKLGAINIHPSKLPKYRGPSPIQSQILDGVTDSAISFILMDEEVDHGPIIFQEPYEIEPEDTFESLLTSMFNKSAQILPTVINGLVDKKLEPITQDDSQATSCREIKKEDGYFDIENPPSPEVLDRMIRAYYPWPGTWTKWNGKIVKFLPDEKIQMEGKKAVTLKEFLNGYPNFPLRNL
jgi:methionyl-tRNA formyltransferase